MNILVIHGGGQFKDTNNQIITKYADGSEEIRFTPPAALITPELIEQLCAAYDQAVERSDFSPLILAGAFIFDFVSIHPFKDGNGANVTAVNAVDSL